MMTSDSKITIGKITKNQGNKGEVRVIPLTDFKERFELLEQVSLEKNNEIKNITIEKVRYHKQFVIIKFKEIDDIEQALKYKDYLITIPDTQVMSLAEDKYYVHELLGYRVITEKDEDLGELVDIITTGGTDIFLVKGMKKQYMLPAAKEFLQIDKSNNLIIVDPIPGLLDL